MRLRECGGGHKRRRDSLNVRQRVGVWAILSDFWNEKLYDLTADEGRNALIQIFKSPDLVGDGNKDLAKTLQELSSRYHLPSVSPAVPRGDITQEMLEKAVRKALIKPSDPGKSESREKFLPIVVYFRVCREPSI